MSQRFEVIVAGVGAMGAACCRELAARGKRVLGLDAYDIPNDRSSHHGRTRMIRTAYFEHPDYVALLHHAWEGWRKLQADTGAKLLHPTGGLYLGPEGGELVGGSLRAAEEHHLSYELLGPGELRRRYPMFRLPAEWVGFLEEQAGFLLAEESIAALAADASRHGAELHAGEAVLSWSASAGGVTIDTEQACYQAERLVLTAGAWSGRLLGELGHPMTTTRQTLFWFDPVEPAQLALGALPAWALEPGTGEEPGLLYGFPAMDATGPGFKSAWHRLGEHVDPDSVDRTIAPDEHAVVHDALARYLPAAAGALLRGAVCLYTRSRDGHFLIDRHPEHEQVVFGAGFSGHGFKFAPVVGAILADLLLDGRSALPADFLSLARDSS